MDSEIPWVKVAFFFLLGLSFLVTWRFNKKNKLGCVGKGYVILVVFLVGMFALMITFFLTKSSIEGVQTYRNGEKYLATIVSYSDYISEDSDGREITMYTPTYEVMTKDGERIRIEDTTSSSSQPTIGAIEEIYYNVNTGKMLNFSAGFIALSVGMFIMWFIMAFAFVGILMYALNFKMDKYFKALQVIGVGFFIPFIMIAFEALLIYALFAAENKPGWVVVLLSFFILGLGLGIIGYIKMLLSKGTPKWKQTSAMSWSADWEDDDEDEIEDQPKEARRPQKMVPLNKELLNKNKK